MTPEQARVLKARLDEDIGDSEDLALMKMVDPEGFDAYMALTKLAEE